MTSLPQPSAKKLGLGSVLGYLIAGALIGLWDYQDGVPGLGDHKVIPGMWYSIELQATTPVPKTGPSSPR